VKGGLLFFERSMAMMTEYNDANSNDTLIEDVEAIANALCGEDDSTPATDRLRHAVHRIAEHYKSSETP